MLSVYSNQIVISTIIYIQESFYGGASRPSHSFKNFDKHVKYKIQQPQLFTDYNLYIVQKLFPFHMFPNGTKIKHHIKPSKRLVTEKPRRFPFQKLDMAKRVRPVLTRPV